MKRQATKEEQIIALKECHYNQQKVITIAETLQRARNASVKSLSYSYTGKNNQKSCAGLDIIVSKIDEIERQLSKQLELYLNQLEIIIDLIEGTSDYWEKLIIAMKYIDGLPYCKIAKQLDMSERTAKTLCKRTLERLGLL